MHENLVKEAIMKTSEVSEVEAEFLSLVVAAFTLIYNPEVRASVRDIYSHCMEETRDFLWYGKIPDWANGKLKRTR